MKINIIGDGAFGSFLKELLAPHFELDSDATSHLLAVPYNVYEGIAKKIIAIQPNAHFINVCSIQEEPTNILLGATQKVTSIHPLFGPRTPADKRNSILTYQYG